MVLELNASDDRTINVVREEIKNFASTRTIFASGFKLVILDEADAMTGPAQFALRRSNGPLIALMLSVIEKFTANTRFCIIANHVNKIIPALQVCIQMAPLVDICRAAAPGFALVPLKKHKFELVLSRSAHQKGPSCRVSSQHRVKVSTDGLAALERLGKGDMRRCVNTLQATAMSFGNVDGDSVYACTGQPLPRDVQNIVHLLLNETLEVAYRSNANISFLMRSDFGYENGERSLPH